MATFPHLCPIPQLWTSAPPPSVYGGDGDADHRRVRTPTLGRALSDLDGRCRVPAVSPGPCQAESWLRRWTPKSDESALGNRPHRSHNGHVAAALYGGQHGLATAIRGASRSGRLRLSWWPAVSIPVGDKLGTHAQALRPGHRRSRRRPPRPWPWWMGLPCPAENQAREDERPNRLAGKTDPPSKKKEL